MNLNLEKHGVELRANIKNIQNQLENIMRKFKQIRSAVNEEININTTYEQNETQGYS